MSEFRFHQKVNCAVKILEFLEFVYLLAVDDLARQLRHSLGKFAILEFLITAEESRSRRNSSFGGRVDCLGGCNFFQRPILIGDENYHMILELLTIKNNLNWAFLKVFI